MPRNPLESVFTYFPGPKGVMFFTFGITGKYTEDFAIGMLISLLYIYSQNPSAGGALAQKWQRYSQWLWGVGIVVLVFGAMWHFNNAMQGWPFLNPLLPVFDWLNEFLLALGFGACIAAILYGSAGLRRKRNERRRSGFELSGRRAVR